MACVDIYWFLPSLSPQILGTLTEEDGEEGSGQIWSLCTLLLKYLQVTSFVLFHYGTGRKRGWTQQPYKESGQNSAYHSFVQFQALANVPWTP